MINVKVVSKVSGRVIETNCTPHVILEAFDDYSLVQRITECDCQPIGETNVIECNCDEEWYEYDLYLDGKLFN